MSGKSCCAPGRNCPSGIADVANPEFQRIKTGQTVGMQLIAAGEFLMGNERNYGFPEDGEGPVHPVRLSAFWMDAVCVINAAI